MSVEYIEEKAEQKICFQFSTFRIYWTLLQLKLLEIEKAIAYLRELNEGFTVEVTKYLATIINSRMTPYSIFLFDGAYKGVGRNHANVSVF